ncbi:MAG: glycosyltransferase family 2 protein [Patescibacteria group bacterium]
MKKPLISVVIATYNSDRTLALCLRSLKTQKFPREKIELIIADGGSTDQTLLIAKQFQARVVKVPADKQGAEYNKAYGLQYAKGEYLLCIDHDNILPHSNWLTAMMYPFSQHKDLVAVEPLRYRYQPNLSLLDRYFALFGVNDPLPYYLGKADRMDYFHQKYNLLGQAQDKGEYYLVRFNQDQPQKIPTLGANGFLIKRKYFLKSRHQPGEYFHIDINVDLVAQGYNQYAFIKDDIIHLTNSEFINFVVRRAYFMNKYYLADFSKRRYRVFYLENDGIKLLLFIVYAITLIKPLLDSLRGYIKIKDKAWFLHPPMCLAMVVVYGQTFVIGMIRKVLHAK